MKKKLNKITNNFERIITIFLTIAIITIFILSYITASAKLSIIGYSYYLISIGAIGLLLVILKFILNKEKIEKIDIFMYLLAILGLISVLISNDKETGFLGALNRNEGWLVLSTYYVLFLLGSLIRNKKNKLIIIYTFLSVGLIHFLIALATNYNILGINTMIYKKSPYLFGIVGNSNFFGSYMVMCYGLSCGLFFLSNKFSKIINLILSIIFLFGIYMCGARSALIGLIFIIISCISYFILKLIKEKKLDYKKLISLIIVIVSVFLVYFTLDKIIKPQGKPTAGSLKVDVMDVVTSDTISEKAGTYRIFIWKKALQRFDDYYWTGLGVDQFYKLSIITPAREFVDKAHNEYLQIFTTEGVFTLVIYLILLFTIFINSIKNLYKEEDNMILFALFLCFIGYISQAFFNISVTRVAPMFFLMMGLLVVRKNNSTIKK